MCSDKEDERHAASSDWWSLLRDPQGQKGTRTPLLCILEPINTGVDWLQKHVQQNIRFDPLLRPCTAEWITRNVSLCPYNLRGLTTITNP